MTGGHRKTQRAPRRRRDAQAQGFRLRMGPCSPQSLPSACKGHEALHQPLPSCSSMITSVLVCVCVQWPEDTKHHEVTISGRLGQGRKLKAEASRDHISVVSWSPFGTASLGKSSEAQKSGSQVQPRVHCYTQSGMSAIWLHQGLPGVWAGTPECWKKNREMKAGGYKVGQWQSRPSAPLQAGLSPASALLAALVCVPSASSRTSWSLVPLLERGKGFMIRTQSNEITH